MPTRENFTVLNTRVFLFDGSSSICCIHIIFSSCERLSVSLVLFIAWEIYVIQCEYLSQRAFKTETLNDLCTQHITVFFTGNIGKAPKSCCSFFCGVLFRSMRKLIMPSEHKTQIERIRNHNENYTQDINCNAALHTGNYHIEMRKMHRTEINDINFNDGT